MGKKVYKVRQDSDHPGHAEYTLAQKTYKKTVEYSKKHHWHDWLEKASDLDIWTAHRYILAPAGDGGKARIPNLLMQGLNRVCVCGMNQDKSKALAKAFFQRGPNRQTLQQMKLKYYHQYATWTQ